MTLLDALVEQLRQAAAYNRSDRTPPAAVLWPDPERQWAPLVPRLREALPLFSLGEYDPAEGRGPAIWLRCVIAGVLPEVQVEDTEATPVLYLPGVSRAALRAVEECPPSLKPLAELQYRGCLWSGPYGREWTVAAFLAGPVGAPAAADPETRAALLRALPQLADEPVAALRAEAPLTAAKINARLAPDETRRILLWLDDPAGRRAASEPAEWEAFCAICRENYSFDPETDGELAAAALLGGRAGAWDVVWNRFAEAPRRYPHLPERLRRARPPASEGLFEEPASWPQENEAEEAALRERLPQLKLLPPAQARVALRDLEERHGRRREWVWAELGQAPLARALPALVELSEQTQSPPGGDRQALAAAYTESGWRADAAALDALAGVERAEDVAVVKAAVEAFYRSWLEESATAFQAAVAAEPLPPALERRAGRVTGLSPGRCVLFSDGVRFDVGQRLATELRGRGLAAEVDWDHAALPTVTPTAKPAVSPVASRLGPGPEFSTCVLEDGARVTVEILRRELAKAGYQILTGDEVGDPTGTAWAECGNLDSYGHEQGWKLARRVLEEVRAVAERIDGLLAAGWQEVRVVTDHGWLLLPGGLPKADLPQHLTEVRKGRCARLKPSASADQQTVPWRWDPQVLIAVAPGISCYTAGKEYEHGGLSPQECVVPLIRVTPAAPELPGATIAEVKWTRLRCRARVTGLAAGLTADLRVRAGDSSSSLAGGGKAVGADGQVSLVVADEDREGLAAHLVLADARGQLVAQQLTTIGGE